ncbi:MAG TPA: hypothetical protein VFF06_10590 [Polyangia bacterium]|nr:hypothetical protein [Polyangia bacterium]
MSEQHLSATAIDAFELGQLHGEDEARARVHVTTCERCRGDLEALRSARERFEREVMPRTLPAVIRRHRRRGASLRRRLLVVLPVIAAAAALLLLLPRGMDLTPRERILVKGGEPALRGFARRGDRVFAVSDGAVLAPGDDLRFVVEPGGRRFVLIASVDGAGHATVYHPYGGMTSAPLDKAPRIELPGSIHLDAAPGPERVFALYSDQPLDAQPVLAELRVLGARGAAAIREQRVLDGARARGATAQGTFLFEKAVE